MFLQNYIFWGVTLLHELPGSASILLQAHDASQTLNYSVSWLRQSVSKYLAIAEQSTSPLMKSSRVMELFSALRMLQHICTNIPCDGRREVITECNENALSGIIHAMEKAEWCRLECAQVLRDNRDNYISGYLQDNRLSVRTTPRGAMTCFAAGEQDILSSAVLNIYNARLSHPQSSIEAAEFRWECAAEQPVKLGDMAPLDFLTAQIPGRGASFVLWEVLQAMKNIKTETTG